MFIFYLIISPRFKVFFVNIVSSYLSVSAAAEKEPRSIVMVFVIVGTVIIFVGFLITLICIHYRQKIKREKREKLIAVETARAAIVTQWTKKVIIEKISNASENVTEPLVSIEKFQ